MEEGKRTRNNKVGKRKKHTKSARKKEKKGQIQCEEEDALSISNLTYSEPGSPFPDCRGIQCGTRGLPERQAFS